MACRMRHLVFSAHIAHGDADFRHKFPKIVGNAIVDHGDLPRKAGGLGAVVTNKGHQSPILRRRLGMAAAKAHPRAARLGQVH